MKNTLLLLCIFLFAASSSHSQSPGVNNEAFVLTRMLQEMHCSPRSIDDKLSADVYDKFIERLDPQHIFFTAADIKVLSAYRNSIDDEILAKDIKFLPVAAAIYKKRLHQSDSLIPVLLQKPFDLSIKETLTVQPDSADYAADEKQLALRWSKWLKYYTLRRLCEIAASDSVNQPAAARTLAMKQESSVRGKVKETQQRRIKRTLEHEWGYDKYIASIFCNAVAGCFDPHSEYMPQDEKENFEGAVTGVHFSFGLELDETEDGEVVIAHLVPGGPAWRSGELNKDDVLLKIKWENKPEIDLSSAGIDDVGEMLSNLNHDKLDLTVRKPGGIEKTVSLVKEKIRDDESFVKSFVLKGEKKIGYILLPGFYTEWGNEGGSSCANDVAKQIIKLKQENIDGIVLDLRNNGGGSLQEAIDMAGIFIDEGPLGFVKGREPKPRSIKDINRGTIYDGPLVVMVNGQSASASEMVAGALQDYNRALVVGSPSFGKATVQVVLPLDSMPDGVKKPTAFIKLTIQKLYRVTGRSNQVAGVTPDIALPDMLSGVDYRESSYSFVLSPDTVKRSAYYKPLASLPVRILNTKSEARVQGNEDFKKVKELAAGFGNLVGAKETGISLQWDDYMKRIQRKNELFKMAEKHLQGAASDLYKADNNLFDKESISEGTYRAELNARLLQNISTDIYIQETYRIITDLAGSAK
jgi:carboxyl-terminal processing protease